MLLSLYDSTATDCKDVVTLYEELLGVEPVNARWIVVVYHLLLTVLIISLSYPQRVSYN